MLRHHRARRALAAFAGSSLVVLAACGDDASSPTPVPTVQEAAPTKVAVIEQEGTRPVLHVQKADGSQRTRVHFDGAADRIPDQHPLVPRLEDANILAMGPIRWSPDGQKLAIVVTLAYDQSMIVVVDATGANATVASVNSQRIMTDVDWSVDGKHLVYGMSTRGPTGGIDVFVTDLALDRVRRITNGLELGMGAAVRFDAIGSGVHLVRWTGDQAPPLINRLSRIDHITLATGAMTPLAVDVVGEVVDVSRTGVMALVLRRRAPVPGGEYDKQLVRATFGEGGGEHVLIPAGVMQSATLSPFDTRAVLVVNEAPSNMSAAYGYYSVGLASGTRLPLPGTGAATTGVDVYVPPYFPPD